MIHVIVLARTPFARVGLRSVLESDPEITVLADASGLDLIESDIRDVDEIVVDDVSLDVTDGDIQGPALVILGSADHGVIGRLLSAGRPFALLRPDEDTAQLLAAVKTVALGLTVFAPELAQPSIAVDIDRSADEPSEDLTPRERQVLQFVAIGLPNKTIARQLELSEHTVKFHIASVFSKLGASSRAEAVALASRRGLITL
jgi:DNA-binding NarL/FixJ family response regulator